MRILLITSRADIGGGPKHLLDLASEIQRSIPDSFLAIASPNQKPFAPLFMKSSNFFIEIPARKFSLISFLKLLAFCKESNIEIIHSHGRGAGIYSRLLSLFSLRVFHTFHGVQVKPGLSNQFKNFVEKLLSYLNCSLVFVSKSEEENAKALKYSINEKSAVIENGIDLSNATYVSKLDKTTNPINICILSRFDPHKNIKRSIELFAYALKRNPSLRLNIGGYGPEEEELKELVETLEIQNNVTFFGRIDNSEDFLKKQHIYLSTSLGEGLPYTVLEAMKLGVIPLLSNVSGHRDTVSKEFLFSPNNEEDFFIKLDGITNKTHNFENKMKDNFDIKTQIGLIVKLYSSL